MEEVREVLRLWSKGLGKRQIAAFVGLNVKTVRRYLAVATAADVRREEAGSLDEARFATLVERIHPVIGRPLGDGWGVCGAEREFIGRHLTNGVRLSKIRKLLHRRGVVVIYATLRRYAIAELGFGTSAATIPVADCEPGQEIQVDVGWMTYLSPDEHGKRRRFRAMIFSAVRSRHRFVWPIESETTEALIEGCEAAWEFFGGIFRVLIADNTKAIVQHADPIEPRITTAFLEYAQVRGFVVDPTRVRSPQDKGRVERAVQTVRDDCFAGEDLSTIEAARAHARRWCLEEYGMRRHGRTQRLPKEQFEAEERAVLLAAPVERYDIPIWCDPKVARDQFAQVAKALYSLPTKYVGKTLRARADRITVRFYDAHRLVKTHPRQGSGGRSIDRADYPFEKTAYALRDVDFLARQASQHGEAIGEFARRLLAGDLPWTRMRQVYALTNLVRKFGAPRVDEACRRALAAEMMSVHRLRRMIELATRTDPPTVRAEIVPAARFLRPASQFAFGFARSAGGVA